MQVTLDSFSLKPFTRALTCLSKYGDDLVLHASAEGLSLSTTNSSMSAYCRFRYRREFFVKYDVGTGRFGSEQEESNATGQLITKSLLAILKHRTVEKTVEKCEISIVEGSLQREGGEQNEDNRDSLESKLIVRFHCHHGIVKTHYLFLLTPTSLLTPGMPDSAGQSRIKVSPLVAKEMLEHFPPARGVRSDPQLVWKFGDVDVEVRSYESTLDSKGKPQLSTELGISIEELDEYDIALSPVTIAFHLKEFSATIAYAESMSTPLELRFTDPAAPLFINIEEDNAEILFVVSTSQVHAAANSNSQPFVPPGGSGQGSNRQKRSREQDAAPSSAVKPKRPIKAAQRYESVSEASRASRSASENARVAGSMPPPSFIPASFGSEQGRGAPQQLPLFYPSTSQMTAAEQETMKALGFEGMTAEDLAEMLEGEGEEVDFGMQRSDVMYASMEGGFKYDEMDNMSLGIQGVELSDDEVEMYPTQDGDQGKAFIPLFED